MTGIQGDIVYEAPNGKIFNLDSSGCLVKHQIDIPGDVYSDHFLDWDRPPAQEAISEILTGRKNLKNILWGVISGIPQGRMPDANDRITIQITVQILQINDPLANP